MLAAQPRGSTSFSWQTPVLRLRATAPFELLIAVSWIGLAWWSATDQGSSGGAVRPSMTMGPMPGMHTMSGTSSMPGMAMSASTPVARAAIGGLPMWAVMVTAMALPGALPALSHVATHSYRWRRRRAMSEFAIVYVALWVAFGAFALTIARLVQFNPGLAFGLALALGCAWQLTNFKRQAVRDCHRSVPLPPDGPSATAGVARFGLVNGGACLRACWPAMLAMAVVPASRMLLWMAILTGLITAEKLTRRPRLTSGLVATALGLGAIVAAAVA